MSFVRAHSPEQREVRRTAILDTARAMLNEMPVADITLNGLSRRACMAKSNVLRYFESREAVLLELCTEALAEWVNALEPALAHAIDSADPLKVRTDRVADVIVASLAARPTLCDLMSTQATVLEHNISTETVLRYKRASIANVERLAALVLRHLPELGKERAARFTDARRVDGHRGVDARSGATRGGRGVRVRRVAGGLPVGLHDGAARRARGHPGRASPSMMASAMGGSADERVDRAGAQHLVEHHRRRARHRGVTPMRSGHHLEFARRHRCCVAVQRLS